MTETQPYSFISVSSAEDDEVIQAGVGISDKQQAPTQVEKAGTTPKAEEVRPSDVRTQDAVPAATEPVSRSTSVKPPNVASTAESKQDNEPVPFAHMQKVILIVLAVFVLAFIIYYNLSIR